MNVYFAHAHFPVTSLGYGPRVGIWLQGCSIRCKGCVVPHMWDPKPEHSVDVATLVARLVPWLAQAEGLTISGGEPFDQPDALLTLIRAARAVLTGDVLVYSGRNESVLRSEFPELLSEIDVLISEPYIEALPDSRPFVGSSNQKILLLTELGEQRYSSAVFRRGMDVAVVNGAIMMAGVPKRGDIAKATTAAGPISP